MPNKLDDTDSGSSSGSSPPPPPRRGKFDDEEEDSDVVEDWEAEEEEAEKAEKSVEAPSHQKANTLPAAKSKSQRRQEHIDERQRKLQGDETDDDSEEEDQASKAVRLRQEEREADMLHSADLFGLGREVKHVAVADPKNPAEVVDLSTLAVFQPQTKDQFAKLREILAPLLRASSGSVYYHPFILELSKTIAQDFSSDQIKKMTSGLTTLYNDKLRDEKATEKGGKKTKAAKSKVSLNASRNVAKGADLSNYGADGFGNDDFM